MNRITVFSDVVIFDSLELHIQPELSREGYLRAGVQATRAGIFIYKTIDGKNARALRSREAVFEAASMDTIKGIPVTRKHPTELLKPGTARGALVGATGDTAEKKDDFLICTVNVFDGPTIEAVTTGGKREVSMGYEARITAQPGIDPEFGPYDLKFDNIRYNHLAVALEDGEARGGHDVRLLMDSKDLTLPKTEDDMAAEMKKIKLGDGEHEVTPALHDAIQNHISGLDAQHKANHDKLAEQLADVTRKNGAVKDDADDLGGMAEASEGEEEDSKKVEAKMDAIEPKSEHGKTLKAFVVKTLKALGAAATEKTSLMDSVSPEKISALATERAKIVGTVCAMDSKAVAADLFKIENLELMKKAILLRTPKANFEGMDSARIQGQFDMVAAQVSANVGKALGAALMDASEEAAKGAAASGPKRWEAKPLASSSRIKAKV